MRNLWMNSSNKRLRDSTKWERPNGREKIRLESTSWRTCISLERKTFYSSRPAKRKWTGSSRMRSNRSLLPSLSRMPSSRPELPRKLLTERAIRWTSWSKWTRKIESRGPICRRKCTKKEQLSLQS
jgi:hypothetical protein